MVLEVRGSRALLLSRYALAESVFNTNENKAAWETSSIRTWLNDQFFRDAFTDDEQNAVIGTKLSEMLTDENLFLLDDAEAAQYFASDKERIARPSAALGKKIGTEQGACRWWLRSSSTSGKKRTMYIDASGRCKTDGSKVTEKGIAIRPAMWIDLGKAGFVAAKALDSAVQVGETVSFGQYAPEQADGQAAKDIEWIVAKRSGSEAVLVSRSLIDGKPFDDSGAAKPWAECSLRAWLNGYFLQTAFSDRERAALIETEQNNGSEPTTWDTVTLLSVAEAELYFATNENRVAEPTAEADPYVDYFKCWWLRDRSRGNPLYVSKDGSMPEPYSDDSQYPNGVRPVIVVDLNAL